MTAERITEWGISISTGEDSQILRCSSEDQARTASGQYEGVVVSRELVATAWELAPTPCDHQILPGVPGFPALRIPALAACLCVRPTGHDGYHECEHGAPTDAVGVSRG